jgi:3-hydroxyisobutyrate dehydrogenase-like beta-hydroxyacid dehydrogenase
MGAKAKLLSNFLALGTASLVIESLKFAKKLKIDWKKFYDLSSLGSGSSKSLDRIAPQAIKNNYDSYFFTINNTIKDFKYMLKLFDGHDKNHKILS